MSFWGTQERFADAMVLWGNDRMLGLGGAHARARARAISVCLAPRPSSPDAVLGAWSRSIESFQASPRSRSSEASLRRLVHCTNGNIVAEAHTQPVSEAVARAIAEQHSLDVEVRRPPALRNRPARLARAQRFRRALTPREPARSQRSYTRPRSSASTSSGALRSAHRHLASRSRT